MRVNYVDYQNFPVIFSEVSWLIEILNKNSSVYAYGSLLKHSFLIMDDNLLLNDTVYIYDAEVNSSHISIMRIEIPKYKNDECWIYSYNSTSPSEIKTLDNYLNIIIHQSSDDKRLAKEKIRKYLWPIEKRYYINIMFIIAIPLIPILVFFILLIDKVK